MIQYAPSHGRGQSRELEPTSPLEGQVAVVAGGSGGIGRAISRALAERGCRVVVAGPSAQRVAAVARSIGAALEFSGLDLGDEDSVRALFARTVEQLGRVDVFVNCVCIGRSRLATRAIPDPIMTLPVAEWNEMVCTNINGLFLSNSEAARHMLRAGGGQIMNVSSARGARRGFAFGAPYCASKHALNSLTESLAEELAPYGIRAQCFLPDAVDTDLISHTNLGSGGVISPATVSEFVVGLLERPLDCTLPEPILLPFGGVAPPSQSPS